MIALLAALWLAAAPAAANVSYSPTAAPADRVELIPDFHSDLLGNTRPVAVYLPPGYREQTLRSYPVLYFQDGQNAFDPRTAFMGRDWQVGRTCDRLILAGRMKPIIIVAPFNLGDPTRMNEYSPVVDLQEGHGAGGRGDLYIRSMLTELEPMIASRYRLRRGERSVMGSSLGAVISLHAALTRRDDGGRPAFAGAAALSLSLEWAEGFLLREAKNVTLPSPLPRLWLDEGTEEYDARWYPDHLRRNDANLAEFARLKAILRERGWENGQNLLAPVIEGAEHNELFWRRRVGEVLRFLFSPG
ncbi:MAG: alpha/beta hydrolase [Elusimicrobia bacterium]|nr:alpha/beta hydrolase [Elusimicrobiota bacterium]MDE2237100.1 alpha/beta hydrolase [Elusimicrobiota bacterium]MDE2425234.1 alpha/beta hydrolase [Elusimicrobiota bacterium]